MSRDMLPPDVELQRRYYSRTASQYHAAHVRDPSEHDLALALLLGMLDYFEIQSILDVGSGTGRAILYIREQRLDINIIGIEPVAELRAIGHELGIPPELLIDGDATRLAYADGQFDLVCAFGVLHHIGHPDIVVAEMLRVARKAVFISDGNNFAHGSSWSKFIKQTLRALHLWRVAVYIKTRGKGYTMSEGDGLTYSYSVFNSAQQIREQCDIVHIMNTRGSGANPYRTASHVTLLGIKTMPPS